MHQNQKARGIVRAAVTKLIHRLDALPGADGATTSEIEGIAVLLGQKGQQLKELDQLIQNVVDDANFEEEFTSASRYQDDIALALLKTRQLIARTTTSPNPPPGAAAPSEGSGSNTSVPGQLSSLRAVALPKLHVPVFGGKLEDCQGFWDHFRATIHECSALPKIEKFKYLLSYLSGAAKRSIEWISISEANYDVAVETLQGRFGRRGALVDAHIDKLLNLHQITAATEVDKLRDLYDTIKFRTGCLQNLGVPQSTYAVILYRVLMRCLPEEIAIEFRQRQIERADWGPQPSSSTNLLTAERINAVDDMMRFLRYHIESREDCGFGRRKVLSREAQDLPAGAFTAPPTALSLPVQSTSGNRPQPCPLCESTTHRIADCHAIVDPTEKLRLLAVARCCFKCGKPNHVARSCRSSSLSHMFGLSWNPSHFAS